MEYKRKPSQLSISRLPKYLIWIDEMRKNGIKRVSSIQMSKAMGGSSSQIRQDFGAFGNFGSQGYGYHTEILYEQLKYILGIYKRHEVAIIGVGSIGHALIEHMDFERYNFHLTAGFDVDSSLTGTTINGIKIYPLSELPNYLDQQQIDICMLTVSPQAAKEVAGFLHDQGISAIWNFTNQNLELQNTDVVVQDVNILESLLVLTYHLENN